MKTFLLSLILFLTSFLFSQTEKQIEMSLLKNVNEYRLSKNLGEFTSNQESNNIAKDVYNIYGSVDPMTLLNQIGVDKDWAIYMVERYSFSLLKNVDNSNNIDKYIKSYISDTSRVKNCEWFYKSNVGNDKPYLFGIHVLKIKDDNHYETYKLFFITLKNIPMEYKCFRPTEN